MYRPLHALTKKAIPLVVMFCILMCFPILSEAGDISFTLEEENFLAQGIVLKAVSIDGGAPLHYRDSEGVIKGIAVNVLDEMANMTGLIFEYELYESIGEVIDSKPDIAFGVSKEYQISGYVLSNPYLESEAILFYNKSFDPLQLGGKRYAAIQGGALPEGISEKDTVYFNAREDTLDAVESGKADYGFGNAYSVAFYTLQNGFNNIITIPVAKEEREYCVAVLEGNDILLSIINKAIGAIDKSRMDTLVLDIASQIERKITVPMVLNVYWKQIVGLIVLVLAILGYSTFLSLRAKKQFEMEIKRYRIISRISNEYLFEYRIGSDLIYWSDIFVEELSRYINKEEVHGLLKNTIGELASNSSDENTHRISLPLVEGENSIYKIIFSHLRDGSGKTHSVIGKLVDISEEEKEKEILIAQSRQDGLTGLYNVTAAKEAIVNSMKKKSEGKLDALIIIDCDKFKDINDNYGHLMGNRVLESIAGSLRKAFRQTDILGRVGGDEFCVYMHDVPSAEFVHLKCRQLVSSVRKLNKVFGISTGISVSMGVAILEGQSSYEELFQQADDALYMAKEAGGAQIVIYSDKNTKEVSK